MFLICACLYFGKPRNFTVKNPSSMFIIMSSCVFILVFNILGHDNFSERQTFDIRNLVSKVEGVDNENLVLLEIIFITCKICLLDAFPGFYPSSVLCVYNVHPWSYLTPPSCIWNSGKTMVWRFSSLINVNTDACVSYILLKCIDLWIDFLTALVR